MDDRRRAVLFSLSSSFNLTKGDGRSVATAARTALLLRLDGRIHFRRSRIKPRRRGSRPGRLRTPDSSLTVRMRSIKTISLLDVIVMRRWMRMTPSPVFFHTRSTRRATMTGAVGRMVRLHLTTGQVLPADEQFFIAATSAADTRLGSDVLTGLGSGPARLLTNRTG